MKNSSKPRIGQVRNVRAENYSEFIFIALYRTTKWGLISACLLQLNIAATTNPPTTHTPTAPRYQLNIYTVSNPTKSRVPDGLRARFPCPSNLFQYYHLRPFGRGLATRYARNLPHDSRLIVLAVLIN